MPRRLATSWATLTQAARRAHPTAQDAAAPPADADAPAFDWAEVADVDVDEQEEQEVPYPGQEPPPELDAVPPPGQELPPPLWPDQVVAANSFAS